MDSSELRSPLPTYSSDDTGVRVGVGAIWPRKISDHLLFAHGHILALLGALCALSILGFRNLFYGFEKLLSALSAWKGLNVELVDASAWSDPGLFLDGLSEGRISDACLVVVILHPIDCLEYHFAEMSVSSSLSMINYADSYKYVSQRQMTAAACSPRRADWPLWHAWILVWHLFFHVDFQQVKPTQVKINLGLHCSKSKRLKVTHTQYCTQTLYIATVFFFFSKLIAQGMCNIS